VIEESSTKSWPSGITIRLQVLPIESPAEMCAVADALKSRTSGGNVPPASFRYETGDGPTVAGNHDLFAAFYPI
jgi:hypothetical protein